MVFDYLVIIDLWESNIIPVKPGSVPEDYKEVYKSNLTFFVNALNLYNFKNIIISNGTLGGPVPKSEPMIYEWAKKQQVPIHETEKYHHHQLPDLKEFKPSDSFLVTGTSWEKCLHARDYGFIKLLDKGHSVYSYPFLCMNTDCYANNFTTGDDFRIDCYIKWDINNENMFYKALRYKLSRETEEHHIQYRKEIQGQHKKYLKKLV
jgi:hypothetical protein